MDNAILKGDNMILWVSIWGMDLYSMGHVVIPDTASDSMGHVVIPDTASDTKACCFII